MSEPSGTRRRFAIVTTVATLALGAACNRQEPPATPEGQGHTVNSPSLPHTNPPVPPPQPLEVHTTNQPAAVDPAPNPPPPPPTSPVNTTPPPPAATDAGPTVTAPPVTHHTNRPQMPVHTNSPAPTNR